MTLDFNILSFKGLFSAEMKNSIKTGGTGRGTDQK